MLPPGVGRLAKAGDAVGLELALAQRAAAFGAVEVDQRLDRGRVEQGAVAEPHDLGVLGQRLLVGAVERRELGDELAVSAIAGEQSEQRQQRQRLRRRTTAVGRLLAQEREQAADARARRHQSRHRLIGAAQEDDSEVAGLEIDAGLEVTAVLVLAAAVVGEAVPQALLERLAVGAQAGAVEMLLLGGAQEHRELLDGAGAVLEPVLGRQLADALEEAQRGR